jgi:mersacidin/lichenicidin family type 2 lantibiotic
MAYQEIIRAWKGKEYQRRLSEEQRAVLPEHPVGLIELADAELSSVASGFCFYDIYPPICFLPFWPVSYSPDCGLVYV